jgi:hypothetical protein
MHHLTVVFRADREYEFNVHAEDVKHPVQGRRQGMAAGRI